MPKTAFGEQVAKLTEFTSNLRKGADVAVTVDLEEIGKLIEEVNNLYHDAVSFVKFPKMVTGRDEVDAPITQG